MKTGCCRRPGARTPGRSIHGVQTAIILAASDLKDGGPPAVDVPAGSRNHGRHSESGRNKGDGRSERASGARDRCFARHRPRDREALAANGARVAVNYRAAADQADAVVRDIVATGGTAVTLQADISDARMPWTWCARPKTGSEQLVSSSTMPGGRCAGAAPGAARCTVRKETTLRMDHLSL